jgi:hypothetical protein
VFAVIVGAVFVLLKKKPKADASEAMSDDPASPEEEDTLKADGPMVEPSAAAPAEATPAPEAEPPGVATDSAEEATEVKPSPLAPPSSPAASGATIIAFDDDDDEDDE